MSSAIKSGATDAELRGVDFVARVRLYGLDNVTVADVGATCERIPAPRHGGTVSDTLRKMLAAGLIAPKPASKPEPAPTPDAPQAQEKPSHE
jgi:hypothetical protein